MKCMMMFAAAAIALASVAQEPAANSEGRKGPRERPMRMAPMPMDPVMRVASNPKLAEKLGVTPEQAAKLKALVADRTEIRALQDKVQAGMRRQAELLNAEKIDESAVMAALDEIWEARKAIAKAQTKRVIAAKSVLTADQLKNMTEAMRALRAGRSSGPRAEGGKKHRRPKAAAKPQE